MPTNDDLIEAVNNRDPEAVRLCLQDPHVDPNARNKEGTPALDIAVARKSLLSVWYLLEAKADPNLTASNHISPLIAASARGYVKIVKVLVHYGAHVTERSLYSHRTPYETAQLRGHIEIANFLKAKEQEQEREWEQNHHTAAEFSQSLNHQTGNLRHRNVHPESQEDETDVAAKALGLLVVGNSFWGGMLGVTAGVLFGASGLCQQGPGENRRTNQAVHTREEEEERIEDSDNALTSSHEHVMERLGQPEPAIEEEANSRPFPGVPYSDDINEQEETEGLEAAAQGKAKKLMKIVEGETSSDNPAPSPT